MEKIVEMTETTEIKEKEANVVGKSFKTASPSQNILNQKSSVYYLLDLLLTTFL